jgi:hypothetical protein
MTMAELKQRKGKARPMIQLAISVSAMLVLACVFISGRTPEE